MKDSIKIAIAGATGYVGIQLVKILSNHPKVFGADEQVFVTRLLQENLATPKVQLKVIMLNQFILMLSSKKIRSLILNSLQRTILMFI